MNIRDDLRILRWKQIRWALGETRGNQRAAARMLNIPSPTFDRWMRELNLGDYAATLRAERIWALADAVVRREHGRSSPAPQIQAGNPEGKNHAEGAPDQQIDKEMVGKKSVPDQIDGDDKSVANDHQDRDTLRLPAHH